MGGASSAEITREGFKNKCRQLRKRLEATRCTSQPRGCEEERRFEGATGASGSDRGGSLLGLPCGCGKLMLPQILSSNA